LIDDEFKRPRLEQIYTGGGEREHEAKDGRPEKRPVIAKHAPVNHNEVTIAKCRFAMELPANMYGPNLCKGEAKSEIRNRELETLLCII
jgi:hypothetical protein